MTDESREKQKGSGLGLAIVRSVTELHGGSCGVRNTEKGVEFTIVLRQNEGA